MGVALWEERMGAREVNARQGRRLKDRWQDLQRDQKAGIKEWVRERESKGSAFRKR